MWCFCAEMVNHLFEWSYWKDTIAAGSSFLRTTTVAKAESWYVSFHLTYLMLCYGMFHYHDLNDSCLIWRGTQRDWQMTIVLQMSLEVWHSHSCVRSKSDMALVKCISPEPILTALVVVWWAHRDFICNMFVQVRGSFHKQVTEWHNSVNFQTMKNRNIGFVCNLILHIYRNFYDIIIVTSRVHGTQSVSTVFCPFWLVVPYVKCHCELRVPEKGTHSATKPV